MKVYARFYGDLERLVGVRELQLMVAEDATLRDVLMVIDSITGGRFAKTVLDERGEFRVSSYVILVNGEVVRSLDVRLTDESSVAFVPAAVGGRRLLVCCRNS